MTCACGHDLEKHHQIQTATRNYWKCWAAEEIQFHDTTHRMMRGCNCTIAYLIHEQEVA